MTTLDRIARYIVITLVWLAAFGVMLGMVFSRLIVLGGLAVVVMLFALIGAIAATYILKPPTDLARPQKAKRLTVEPDTLDKLTPDDIDDTYDEEVSPLDELLKDQRARAKRRKS